MANALVTLAEFHDHLGGEVVAEAGIRGAILDQMVATFVRECHREESPFQAAQTARVEVRNGTGSAYLWLHYPVAALTSVMLGYDPAAAEAVTLNVADKKVLLYQVGQRKLARVDGGAFGCWNAPNYVHITYNAAADLPDDAKRAVMTKAANVYWRRGSEESTNESSAGFSSGFSSEDELWTAAIAAHMRAPIP